jgi:hypothetical protein
MKYVVWALVVILVVLHQDYWQWDKANLVVGFLPYSLAYHAGLSVAAAVVWLLATRFCWPDLPDDLPEQEPRNEART